MGQHEVQEERDSQVDVQLLQPLPHVLRQPKRQGSKQSSERRPRRSFSSKQGRGQQLPQGDGAGIGVLHDEQLGAACVPQVLQPP
ncbi:hypothetical protein NA78x_001471 [Anatilimnocola sp. NA78]|uniref:hypothetical protein n=1 Tax=Anatilimnocola sp. NA78 TaxID=3415683 RepID=UPI003CE4B931